MSKNTCPNFEIEGQNADGQKFTFKADSFFRITDNKVVITGKVTSGKIWPLNKIKITATGTNESVTDTVKELEICKLPIKMAETNQNIGICLSNSGFHNLRDLNKKALVA